MITMRLNYLAFVFLLLKSSSFLAQNNTTDSLKQVLKTAKHDTTRCSILNALIESENDDNVWPKYNEQLKQICELNLTKKNLKPIEKKRFTVFYAAVFNNLGYYAENIEADIVKALSYYEKSIKLNEEAGNKAGVATIYNNMAFIYKTKGDIPKTMAYFEKSLAIYTQIDFKEGIAAAYNNIGLVYDHQGNAEKTLEYYDKSLKIQQEIGNKEGVAMSFNNIGLIYDDQGNIPKALEYYQRALKIREEIGDKKGVATSLKSIGYVYNTMGDIPKALEYYHRNLKIREEMGDKKGIAGSLNNLGMIYKNQGDIDKGLDYSQRSLKIYEEIGDKYGIAISLNNMGSIYESKGDLAKALEYYHESLKIREEFQNKEGITKSLIVIGSVYHDQKEYRKAIEYSEKGMVLAKELGFPENIKNAAQILHLSYKATGNTAKALENYELFVAMRDSIINETNKKASLRSQFQYEYEKKAAADSVKVAEEKKVVAVQLQQEKTQRFALYGGIVLIALFSIFMFNRFRVTRKQKQIIELKEKETQAQNVIITQQKHLVEEKHKEITDSINYAERIQRSFLASKELLDENLKDYFVFFKPKDVVSGDFYWAASVPGGQGTAGSKNELLPAVSSQLFFLATADSTGHGVPGAIMSLLNITSLEKALENSVNPAEVLNHTRKIIIDRLKKDGSAEGGKDGMDCSLIAFDFEKKQMQIAAAHNPVWIVRSGSLSPFDNTGVSASRRTGDVELIEIKPDKMPVGKHDNDQKPFALQTIDIKEGDTIYTLTDGFPDQFGGPDGKKFMSKKLKALLVENSHLPIPQQKELLETTFTNWVGNLEQVDDVTIIGIRI